MNIIFRKLRFLTGNIGLAALAIVLGLAPRAGAQGQFVVNYSANFDSLFGGLPVTQMQGTFSFAATPSFQENEHTSFYNAMQSGSFNLNGLVYGGNIFNTNIRVDNNIPLGGQAFRDGFYGILFLEGIFAGDFELIAAGLQFEQVGEDPSAFDSLALPTSVADLGGFTPLQQNAVLVFKNLNDGISYATYAPLQSLSFAPVPEPSVAALLGVGVAGLCLLRRKQSEKQRTGIFS